jgi:hypothetical protein
LPGCRGGPVAGVSLRGALALEHGNPRLARID